MNERIKQLWDDAALMAGDESNTWDGQVAFMALFAELIVRECVEVVRWTPSQFPNDAYVKNIQEHFGVEHD